MPLQLKGFVRRNASLILFIVAMACFRTAVADWNYVPSSSMEPTLYPGDVLVINKLAYGPSVPFTKSRLLSWAQPERGDVITFFPSHTDQCLVKRVIGVPGDRLSFRDDGLWLNGQKVEITETDGDHWAQLPNRSHRVATGESAIRPVVKGDTVIPKGKYFVMGDNRNKSYDSRYWGLVDESQVVGKVAAVGLNFSHRFTRRFATDVL